MKELIRKLFAALRRFDEDTLEFLCDVLMVLLMACALLLCVVFCFGVLVMMGRWALAGFPL